MIIVDPNRPRGIVWIASYPKSGNTWIRIFLYHLIRLTEGVERTDNDLDALDRASGYESRFFSLFEELLEKPLTEATPKEVAEIRASAHAAVAERAESVLLIKNHNVLGNVFGHPMVNLNVSAGTIYMVRDPRDIVLSLADHLGCNVDQAIDVMNRSAYSTENSKESAFEVWGSWSEHVKGWTMVPSEAVIIVRYEDLLSDPFTQFTKVIRHLRQKPSEDHIREALKLSTFSELSDQEQRHGFRERSPRAERFFRVGKAGQWRAQLTPYQVRRIVGVHGEQMRKFGYEI